eukprot:COSAG06_NODE_8600_length_2118_cov_3.915305_2_plen_106_part_00
MTIWKKRMDGLEKADGWDKGLPPGRFAPFPAHWRPCLWDLAKESLGVHDLFKPAVKGVRNGERIAVDLHLAPGVGKTFLEVNMQTSPIALYLLSIIAPRYSNFGT